MRVESNRESALRSEGREVPHRSHAGCHRERIKRRADKARRAYGKKVAAVELRAAENDR